MPTPNLTFTSVDQDGVRSTLTDSTVYTSPARSSFAVYLAAYKVDKAQVRTALTIDTYDPEIATTFRVVNSVDGWYKFLFFIVPKWDGSTSYNQDDVVYSFTEDGWYVYINATPSSGNVVTDPAYWLEVTSPLDYSESANIFYQELDKIISYKTGICFIKAGSKHAKETCGTDDCGCDSRLGKYFHKIRELFTNLGFNDVRGQYLEGEKNARAAQNYCDECGCSVR